ncbi:hypothetical protein BDQ94DRAFT_140545 [Aspergillus welwitschiae]|uniref:Uncharacterized protein n=1 Tax=Aspergillus welwitschiae TaxID=1341132 RepID=A0A3F3Q822_9EURO|nr:hypothetical protein BDQ94DRAFT_140545 [Aspergillus welwitschiae]RDH35275.1 hypothetical protein BDQ94DRAFT_140545 [Aspergillus welwitschiae]
MHDSSPFVRAIARSRSGMPPSAVWPALCSWPRPEGSRRATWTGSTIFYLSRETNYGQSRAANDHDPEGKEHPLEGRIGNQVDVNHARLAILTSWSRIWVWIPN